MISRNTSSASARSTPFRRTCAPVPQPCTEIARASPALDRARSVWRRRAGVHPSPYAPTAFGRPTPRTAHPRCHRGPALVAPDRRTAGGLQVDGRPGPQTDLLHRSLIAFSPSDHRLLRHGDHPGAARGSGGQAALRSEARRDAGHDAIATDKSSNPRPIAQRWGNAWSEAVRGPRCEACYDDRSWTEQIRIF
jgi:hypothetical protein